jgi:RimJ/RimL family protein N-acetyltransferase
LTGRSVILDRSTVVLEGRHVVLRPLRVEDAALTLAWRLGDRTAHLNQGAQTLAEQVEWIGTRPADEVNFVIELRSGVPVGMVSLIAIDTVHRRAEPARFLIGEPAAVKGIPAAVEALKLLYQLAFDELKLQRIYGTVAADNHLMIKWHKSLGMQEEGRLRRHLFLAGHFQDAVCVGLLEDEFRTRTLPRMNALLRVS